MHRKALYNAHSFSRAICDGDTPPERLLPSRFRDLALQGSLDLAECLVEPPTVQDLISAKSALVIPMWLTPAMFYKRKWQPKTKHLPQLAGPQQGVRE